MSINNASGFDQLQSILNGANIVGSSIFDASGTNIGSVSELQSKLKQLYQSQIVDNSNIQNGREAANDMCSLIFKVEQLPRQQSVIHRIATQIFGHEFDEVKSLCLARMRQDSVVMQRVIEKYNELAKDWNARVNYLHNDPNVSQNLELRQLRYLNDFLGLAWSSQQEKGREAVPIYGEFDSHVVDDKSQIYKPSQCETMQQLSSLMKRVGASHEHFMPEMIEQLEDRLVLLYNKGKHLENLSAGPRALETMQAIFELDLHRPKGSKRPKNLDKIWEECRTTFSQDTPLLLKIHRAYNEGIKYANMALVNSCGEQGLIREIDTKPIIFYGAVLGLKMPVTNKSEKNIDYCEMSNIFPESYLSLTQEELQVMQQNFTFRSLLLHQQIELVRMRARVAAIEQKLDYNNLSSLLIDPEIRKKLEQERRELLVALIEMPPTMPKHLFKAIWEEQLRCMELLQIKPNQKQQRMSEPLPIFGFDLPFPIRLALENFSISLPLIINWYNQRVDITNTTRTELELKGRIKELKEVIRDAPITEMWSGITSALDDLRDAEKNLKDWKSSEKDSHRRGWGVAITLEFRSKLLQLAEVLPFVELTREQIMGKEPWPRIDIFEIPRPPDTKLIEELKLLDPDARKFFFDRWPDHWKQNLSDELKNIIESKELDNKEHPKT